MENYVEIFGNIVWKKVTIMQKKTPDYAEISKLNKVLPLLFPNIILKYMLTSYREF